MPGLPGGDEDGALAALARRPVELEHDGHLADRAVGADRCAPRAAPGRARAGRAARRGRRGWRAGRAARRPCSRRRARQVGVVAEHAVQARLDVHAERRSPRPARRATPRTACRPSARRRSAAVVRPAPPPRPPSPRSAPAARAVRHDLVGACGRRGASRRRPTIVARCRSAGRRARSSVSVWNRSSAKRARRYAQWPPGARRGRVRRRARCARPRSRGRGVGRLDQQVAVEVDVVHERRELGRRRDAELRLDHAAEHDAQAERARRVHHAQPPRGCRRHLASLMLTPSA